MCSQQYTAPHFLGGSTLWESCRYLESWLSPPGSLVLASLSVCLQGNKEAGILNTELHKRFHRESLGSNKPPYARCSWFGRSCGGRRSSWSSWSCPRSSWSAPRGCWGRSGSWFSTGPCHWGTRGFYHSPRPTPANQTDNHSVNTCRYFY